MGLPLLPGVTGPGLGRCAVMGVVNVTPDSFADGGVLYPQGHPGAAKGTRARRAPRTNER